MRDRLRHEDDEHVFLRVDPEGGAARPGPVHLADGPFHKTHAGFGTNGKTQSESEAGSGEIIGSRHHARARRDMVRAHVSDGLRAEISLSIQRAPVEHHLCEAGIVADRGHHAAAARFPLLRDAGIVHLSIVADLPVVRKRFGHQ